MGLLGALTDRELAGSTVRYAIAGATVAGTYLAIPLGLGWLFAVPIEVAIPIAYVLAVSLHFMLQRHFVFRHVETFALTTRQQIGRYIAMGAVQYPTTARTMEGVGALAPRTAHGPARGSPG